MVLIGPRVDERSVALRLRSYEEVTGMEFRFGLLRDELAREVLDEDISKVVGGYCGR